MLRATTIEEEVYTAAADQAERLPSNLYTDAQWASTEGYKISDPVRLLTIYNERIRTGLEKLHGWQTRVMLKFAYPDKRDAVHRICVRANNGSGKSKYCIAPCAVWLAMRFKKARCVITSSSGTQLDRQTAMSVVSLARQVNELHKQVLWKINYRYLRFLPTDSTIELYATDDPGKAEGYHPFEDGAEFALFVDEGKSVEENIYEAIARCNGMTRRMDVSSPGGLTGHFYSINFSERWHKFVITYRDCPHIKQDEIDEARERFGENSAWFRKAYLAEFVSIDEDLVMSWDDVQKCIRNAITLPIVAGEPYAGLDLSAGGDENVLSVFKGNVQIALETFRYDDTTLAVDHIRKLLIHYNINPKHVHADDGGVGKSMIDMLWRDGWHVNRVLNQSPAYNNDQYANRGAEMWFNFARIVQECDVVLKPDPTLINQLSSRYYKKGDVIGKIALESKRIARSKGHGSPDRADATVLAFADKSYPLARYINGRELERSVTKPTTDQLIEEVMRQRNAYSGIDSMISGGGNTQLVHDYGEMSMSR